MKKLITISGLFFCAFFCLDVYAQTEAGFEYASDALRFSIEEPIGSTRIQSIGGAQSALGGDISNAAGNPAGLGFFNKSEFSFSPAISINSANAQFLGRPTKDVLGNLNINNFGFVFSKAKDPIVPGKWRGGSFAITLSTTSNYNTRFKYSGVNDTTSLSDAFVEAANGVHYGVLEDEKNGAGQFYTWEALAFATVLIDTIWEGPDDKYFSYNEFEDVLQSETVRTRGSKSQLDISYGGNYDDKLYFGASLGLVSFRHTEEKIYKERVLTDNDGLDDLTDFTLNESLLTRGSGINFGAGLIFRATDFIRLGASFRTPTYFYSVQSRYNADLETFFNEDAPFTNDNIYGEFEPTENNYKFVTPWKFSGGLAFFFNKNGFISADVDYIAYDKLKLFSADEELQFNITNDEIQSAYRPVVNFRVGGEYRISNFRLRGGYAVYGSALQDTDNSINNEKATHYASAGAGMRFDQFYFDFGLIHTLARKFEYYPYLLSDYTEPMASVSRSRTKGMFTLGFFF